MRQRKIALPHRGGGRTTAGRREGKPSPGQVRPPKEPQWDQAGQSVDSAVTTESITWMMPFEPMMSVELTTAPP